MNASLKSFRTPYDGWTTDDLDGLPVDGIRRELVDGVLIVTPAPTSSHQNLARRLCAALDAACPPGFRVGQGCEIRIGHKRSLIPDVLVTTQAVAERSPRALKASEVVLAVEIVSPTSVSIDRVRKPALYAGVGIGSYWRIEPTEGYRLHAYDLAPGGVYTEAGEFDGEVELHRPWPVRFDLGAVRPD